MKMAGAIRKTQIDEVLQRADLEVGYDVTYRRSYSGRGMYGRECFGFVTENVSAQAFTARFAYALGKVVSEHDGDEAWDAITEWAEVDALDPATDSMGMGTIVYWPGYTLLVDATDTSLDEEE